MRLLAAVLSYSSRPAMLEALLEEQTNRRAEHSCTGSGPITSSPGIGRFALSIADWCTKLRILISPDLIQAAGRTSRNHQRVSFFVFNPSAEGVGVDVQPNIRT